ncbi:MAG: hypothetical protein AAF639_24920 [Chloroflexota bacterium]
MSKLSNLYIGRAGQMVVMAEFLVRGYNVAVPEVDVGDDIFVVRDSDGLHTRIQVKTTNATDTQQGYSARYTLKMSQLRIPSAPETWYVFVNRLHEEWKSFLVAPRQELLDLHDLYDIGSVNKNGVLSLYVSYTGDEVICSGQDLRQYLNNWNSWAQIEH